MTLCVACPMRGYGGLWPIMPPHYKEGCNRCAQGLHWSEPNACRHQFTTKHPDCAQCHVVATCGVYPASLVVSLDDVTPELVTDLRAYIMAARRESRLRVRPLTRDNFVTFISDLYRDLDKPIVAWPGREVFMGMSLLEGPSMPYWVRDYLFGQRDLEVRGRIKMLTRPRIAVIASILKAADSEAWCSGTPVMIGKAVTAWMDRAPSREFSEGAGPQALEEEWDDLMV